MPIGKINTIRREIIDIASEKLLNYYKPTDENAEDIRVTIKNFIKKDKKNTTGASKAKNMKVNVYVDNLELLTIANRNPINRIYFDASYIYDNPDDYFENIEDLLTEAVHIASDKEVVWVLPSFTSNDDLVKIKDVYQNLKNNNINISIMGDSPSLSYNFPDANIYASHNMNIWNNYAVKMLDKNNFKSATISSEISHEEIKELQRKSRNYNTKLELIVQGNQEIMTSKDDFTKLNGGVDLEIKTDEYVVLEDKEHNMKFKIYFDYNHQSHFFNNDMLCLIDEIDQIRNMGISDITLDCRFTTPNYLSKVVSLYIQRIRDINPERKYSDSIKEISYSNLNKGNFENKRVLEDNKSRMKRKKARA